MSSSFDYVMAAAIIMLTFVGLLTCNAKILSAQVRDLANAAICLVSGGLLLIWPAGDEGDGFVLKLLGSFLVLACLFYVGGVLSRYLKRRRERS